MEFAGEVVGLGTGDDPVRRRRPGDVHHRRRCPGRAGRGAPRPWPCPCPTACPGTRPAGFPRRSAPPMTPCSPRLTCARASGCSSPVRPVGWGLPPCSWPMPPGPTWWPRCGQSARHADVAGLGADEVIEPDAVPDHGPYDVSLELVGAPGVAAVLPALAIGGRVVVIGVGAGAKVELNLLALMGRRATISGSTLRARTIEEKAGGGPGRRGARAAPAGRRRMGCRWPRRSHGAGVRGLRAVRRGRQVRKDRPGHRLDGRAGRPAMR